MSFITGVGLTAFGRHDGASPLDLMRRAAEPALVGAGLKRGDIAARLVPVFKRTTA